jgi:hypothetical protein
MAEEKKEEEEKFIKKTDKNQNKKLVCDSKPDYNASSNVRPPKERKMVKGIFKNIECPGAMHTFHFRKYKEPVKTYYLMDGGEYELPIEVVEHLNQNCAYKNPKWVSSEGNEELGVPVNAPGQPKWQKQIGKVVSRVAFQPTQYI